MGSNYLKRKEATQVGIERGDEVIIEAVMEERALLHHYYLFKCDTEREQSSSQPVTLKLWRGMRSSRHDVLNFCHPLAIIRNGKADASDPRRRH